MSFDYFQWATFRSFRSGPADGVASSTTGLTSGAAGGFGGGIERRDGSCAFGFILIGKLHTEIEEYGYYEYW